MNQTSSYQHLNTQNIFNKLKTQNVTKKQITAGDRSFQETFSFDPHNLCVYKAAWKFLIILLLVHQYSSIAISTETFPHLPQHPDPVKISLIPEGKKSAAWPVLRLIKLFEKCAILPWAVQSCLSHLQHLS